MCFLLVKFTGKPALHVTLVTVCPPGKGGAVLPSDLRSFIKYIYIFHGFVMLLLLLYMQSQEMDFIGALECAGLPHLIFIVHTLCFSKNPSHSMFIVYLYCGEDRIFVFLLGVILPWSKHYPNRLKQKL